ncbi:MAG: biotin/lipoyl-containing protein [Myxococcota bacterium]|nr:biotin/lipoyl-containing protein [Myxococcota bacterium]
MAYQATGYRRVKNPRIWSLHDLELLANGRRAGHPEAVSLDEAPVGADDEVALADGLVPIRAPMEGSFWGRASPDKPPMAPAGACVGADEGIALIEVMKTFTPIRSPAPGRVERWVVADGDGVRPGQVIGWLRPG